MNVTIQSPSSTLSFGNANNAGEFASLSVVGTAVTTKGLKQAGAVLLDSSSEVTKKGVVRALIRARVPLFDLRSPSDGGSIAGDVAGKPKSGFAQVALTVTVPNTAGIIATSGDLDGTTGVPSTQAAANAVAVALAMQIVLNTVCNQGAAATPVLVHGGSLLDYTLLGTDVQNNPVARGLMGLTPLSGADRGIVAAAS